MLYKLFFIRDGEPIGHLVRHCADDLAALEAAERLSNDQSVEVYKGERFVARVRRGNVPATVRDRYSD